MGSHKVSSVHVCIRVNMCTNRYIYIYIYICVYMYMCICVHIDLDKISCFPLKQGRFWFRKLSSKSS